MSQQGSLSIDRMCQLAQVSRAGFYRSLQEAQPMDEVMAVRAEIQQIALTHRRRYGYRRITAELRRRGLLVNHKRVARLMREDNLLAVKPRAFVVTTEAQHGPGGISKSRQSADVDRDQSALGGGYHLYSLAHGVRLLGRPPGWVLTQGGGLGVGYDAGDTIAAGSVAPSDSARQPPPGMVHHSDRRIQYASGAYVQLLRQYQMIPSMSRPANPYDNASCASFLNTLKREEIYATTYPDLEQVRTNMAVFIEQYYYRTRLHSALGLDHPVCNVESTQRCGARQL